MSLACASVDSEVNAAMAAVVANAGQGGRACHLPQGQWVAVERLSCLRAIYPNDLPLLPGFDEPWTFDDALVEVLRARLGGSAR